MHRHYDNFPHISKKKSKSKKQIFFRYLSTSLKTYQKFFSIEATSLSHDTMFTYSSFISSIQSILKCANSSHFSQYFGLLEMSRITFFFTVYKWSVYYYYKQTLFSSFFSTLRGFWSNTRTTMDTRFMIVDVH